MSFSGFTASDFAAYAASKWTSNAFNLERLQVKEKLSALGRQVAPSMVAADGSPLELELSSEHPALWNQHRVESQHLFFSRNKEARRELEGVLSKHRSIASLIEDPSPLRNHILVSITIDAAGVELALKLHSDAAVDRDNLVKKCEEPVHRGRLLELIRDLPEGHEIGLVARVFESATQLTDVRLQQLVAELRDAGSWLAVRRLFPRENEDLASEKFLDCATAGALALLPILHHVAWSRTNDFLSMATALRDQQVQKRSKGLAKNDRVRVVKGVFSGKSGVVHSIDAKGTLKVMLGAIPVKLAGDDVVKL